MCGTPVADSVVTIVSKIIIGFSRRLPGSGLFAAGGGITRPLQGGAGRVPRGQVLRLPVDRTAPVERFVLRITFAELPRQLRVRQLDAEVKGVRRVVLQFELWPQLEHILRNVMAVAVVDAHA